MVVASNLRMILALSLATWMAIAQTGLARACTYIQVKADDGTYIVGRTMEWGAFDVEPSLSIVPRGTQLSAMEMPDGKSGASWTANYGFTGITLLGKPLFADAINEKGLTGHLLYLPGFAECQTYEPRPGSKIDFPV